MKNLERMQKEQLALFREGEKLAHYSKVQGPYVSSELAHHIFECINFYKWAYSEDEEYKAIEEVIKVYQGFLDGGGDIDFTKE